jgi:hypothetical protein
MPWYNNGTTERFIADGDPVPAGFTEGRLSASGGSAATPSYQKTDVPGVSFDARTGKYVNAFNGQPISESEYANRLRASSPSDPDQNLGAGVFSDDRGYYVWDNPVTDSRLGVTTSGTKRYITEAQAKSATAGPKAGPSATELGNLAARYAELARQEKVLQETIRANKVSEAAAAANLTFLREKEAFEQSQDQTRIANETRTMLFNEQNNYDTLKFKGAEMTSQIQQVNAQMQQSAAQFNAQMSLQTEQANVQAQEQKAARLQSLAGDIATAASDPGDRAKLASIIQANSGWGQTASALGDPNLDLRTEESLAPLEGLLRNRQDVQAQSDRPFSYSPVQAQQIAMPDLSFLTQRQVTPTVQSGNSGGIQNEAAAPAAAAAPFAWMRPAETAALPDWAQARIASGSLQKMKDGGIASGAYIGDEEGPEIHIPLAAGVSMVIPHEQVKKMSPDKKKRMTKMATGGIFAGTGVDSDRTLSTQFLADSLVKARAGTPFEQSLPGSPVYESSPGFNPFLAAILQSIRAQATGLPVAYSQFEAARLAPRGVSEGVVGRSA